MCRDAAANEEPPVNTSPRVTPCLWFNFNAEAAVELYLSVFKDARVLSLARYGEGQPGPAGAVMTIEFEIEGQSFLALNGGPQYPFTPAMSLIVNCDDQRKLDEYWQRLSGARQRAATVAYRPIRHIVADRSARR